MDSETKRTFDSGMKILRHQIEKCHEKYGDDAGGDQLTSKFAILYDRINDYERTQSYNLSSSDSLSLVFNLGTITGICNRYLQNGQLKKEDLLDLNKTYRKYKI